MAGHHHVPAALNPGNIAVTTEQEAIWAPEPVWANGGGENSVTATRLRAGRSGVRIYARVSNLSRFPTELP